MSELPAEHDLRRAAQQQQFLDIVDPATATRRFHEHLKLQPLGCETVTLSDALHRVLAVDVVSEVDVPGFDRSNVDGFAVQAADTFGATEEVPRFVELNREVLSPGAMPSEVVREGTATAIATGAMLPRGADAVVMVEYTELAEEGSSPAGHAQRAVTSDHRVRLRIMRPVTAGENVTFAGTDIARGETVLRAGQVLTSREVGVLAAIGVVEVCVFRRPRVAIISTGDELIVPGVPSQPGKVYDSNSAILSAAVRELGGEPIELGIVPDDQAALQRAVQQALQYDVVLLSGGTSKGAGDLAYRVIERLTDPGIVAHGVALKPGKPICLAVTQGKPVVILPGFPTSAVFTFHEFVAPVLRALAGRPPARTEQVPATVPLRINSQRGRKEFVLVSLVRRADGLAAYPIGKGSGSVTTFSCADGFLVIDQHQELVEAGSRVEVRLLDRTLEPADLVVIGSHCVGLDVLISAVRQRGFTAKTLYVGSNGGLLAARRGECDLAGIHLLDPKTGEYNRPFVTEGLRLLPGYGRMQGLIYRQGDSRFEGRSAEEAIKAVASDSECWMVNRNAGSGTRILIDKLLGGVRPPGYAIQARSHNAVAAAVAQGRADWGIGIETVARAAGLGFLPLHEERYDFVVPADRWDRKSVQAFREALQSESVQRRLRKLGFLI
ncbi:MAG: molybdopterin biosynthesis protein [Planctomycetes bacterium]|nr:molybdopterin biosynthesis protein [Planctomycetota bacterium]